MGNSFGVPSDNFRPNYKYKRQSGSKRKPHVYWTRSPEGRLYKTIIGIIGDQLRGGHDSWIDRKFPSPSTIGSLVRTTIPHIAEWYHERCGEELTDEIIWDRYHKMYYSNKSPRKERGTISEEHYSRDVKLKRYVTSASQIVKDGRASRDQVQTILDKIGG